METETRLKLTDNITESLFKMSEGNPGALGACVEIMQRGGDIDPDSLLGGFGGILLLDSMGIYGTDIYVLWNDICGRDLTRMITLIRGFQLGFVTKEKLKDVSSRQDYSRVGMIDIDNIYEKVKTRLPGFDPENTYKKVEQ